jgi:hypothetical protein
MGYAKVLSDVLPTLPVGSWWGFYKSPCRNFLLHWSLLQMPQEQVIQQHPRFDTSTGSLDSRDAPPRVVQKAKSFVLPNQIGFTH